MYKKKLPVRAGVKRTREANPCATLQQIGDKYGITRERVRQILLHDKLPTAAIIEKRIIYCLNCGKETPNAKFCNQECRYAYYHIEVLCSQCSKMFSLCQSSLIVRTKRSKTGLLFCSKQCWGKWLGEVIRRG